MKKYIISVILIFSFIFIYAEEIVNTQSETMLKEIRRRNGIDEYGKTKERPKKKEDFFKNGRRKFAMGLNLSVQASNSYIKIPDIFQTTLEIDLNKMNEKLQKKGFNVSASTLLNLFLEIYIKDKYQFGIFTSTDIYTLINVPKNIIEFIANGNPDSKDIEGKLNSTAYAFIDQSFFYGMKIKALSFKINASWFLPVLYLDKEVGSYKFSNPDTGSIMANATINTKIYSLLPIFGEKNAKFNIQNFLKSGGIDIDFLGSYNFPPYANLNFGVLNIPIFPARLSKGISKKISKGFDLSQEIGVSSFLDYLEKSLKGEEIKASSEKEAKKENEEIQYNLPKKNIFRPLKIIVSSDIFPFKNKYLILTPNLGFHCLKPFYIDAGLKIESQFAKVLGTYLYVGREDRLWKHKLGFFIDTRIFKMELAGALVSPAFLKSFSLTGTQIDFSLVVGY